MNIVEPGHHHTLDWDARASSDAWSRCMDQSACSYGVEGAWNGRSRVEKGERAAAVQTWPWRSVERKERQEGGSMSANGCRRARRPSHVRRDGDALAAVPGLTDLEWGEGLDRARRGSLRVH